MVLTQKPLLPAPCLGHAAHREHGPTQLAGRRKPSSHRFQIRAFLARRQERCPTGAGGKVGGSRCCVGGIHAADDLKLVACPRHGTTVWVPGRQTAQVRSAIRRGTGFPRTVATHSVNIEGVRRRGVGVRVTLSSWRCIRTNTYLVRNEASTTALAAPGLRTSRWKSLRYQSLRYHSSTVPGGCGTSRHW